MIRTLTIYLALITTLGAVSAAHAADLIGLFERWGAYSHKRGTECYAIAAPETGKVEGAYLSLVAKRGEAPQFYARLPHARSSTTDASASVGGRRFLLTGKGRDLFAEDARMDRAIIAAIRSARALSIEAVDRNGQAIVNGYALKGAASAIDAARLACR